jgi:purine-nucleoside phosphorylase
MDRPAWQPVPEFAARIEAAAEHLLERGFEARPQLGLVLGSGLGEFVERLAEQASAPFGEIPGFAGGKVKAHAGRVVQAQLDGQPLLVLQGRPHAYEGLSMGEVVLPVAVLHRLGCDVTILTNAAGGLRPSMVPGDLAVLEDLVDLHLADVARGILRPDPGMNGQWFARAARAGRIFDPALAAAIRTAPGGAQLHRAVYASVWGPNYEEAAMIGVLRRIGADVVGMSTGPEAAYLHAVGARVAGISCITNVAVEHGSVEVSHDEVVQVGGESGGAFSSLLVGVIAAIARLDRGNP